MAKRKRNVKVSDEEIAQVEADRLEAHGEAAIIEQAEKEELAEAGILEAAPIEDTYVKELTEEVAADDKEFNEPDRDEPEDDAELEPEKEVNSVVALKFKEKYLANARLLGIPGKAAKRSSWDWLAQQIAGICLDEKHKISIERFTGLLDANGVDHSKWTNRNKGWEGRFRMTGRVALQKVVANANQLLVPDGDTLIPPAEFVARFKTKV